MKERWRLKSFQRFCFIDDRQRALLIIAKPMLTAVSVFRLTGNTVFGQRSEPQFRFKIPRAFKKIIGQLVLTIATKQPKCY